MLSLFVILPLAAADDILVWERDDSDFAGNGYVAKGTDGWEGGYSGDGWWIEAGDLYSSTDQGSSSFGSGGAADNYLVRGTSVRQGWTEAELFNEDDDTFGIVFMRAGGNYYIAAIVGSEPGGDTPPGIPTYEDPTVFLARVEGSTVTVLDSADVTVSNSDYTTLSAFANNDNITVYVDDVEVLDVAETLMTAGQSGLYAYNTGWDGGGPDSTEAFATRVSLWEYDEDDDGIADDVDNCEFVANPGQADQDMDGIGNACENGADTDTDTDADTDSDADADADTDADTDSDVDLDSLDEALTGARCGCRHGGTSGALGLALLGLAVARRRRR